MFSDHDFRYDLRPALQPMVLPACAFGVGVAAGEVGNAVPPGEVAQQVVRPNALAGGERIWQLLVEDGDVRAAHGSPFRVRPVAGPIVPDRPGRGETDLPG